jgi:hypothetical protein
LIAKRPKTTLKGRTSERDPDVTLRTAPLLVGEPIERSPPIPGARINTGLSTPGAIKPFADHRGKVEAELRRPPLTEESPSDKASVNRHVEVTSTTVRVIECALLAVVAQDQELRLAVDAVSTPEEPHLLKTSDLLADPLALAVPNLAGVVGYIQSRPVAVGIPNEVMKVVVAVRTEDIASGTLAGAYGCQGNSAKYEIQLGRA